MLPKFHVTLVSSFYVVYFLRWNFNKSNETDIWLVK